MNKPYRVLIMTSAIIGALITGLVVTRLLNREYRAVELEKQTFADWIGNPSADINYVTNYNDAMNEYMQEAKVSQTSMAVAYTGNMFNLSEVIILIPQDALQATAWCGELPNVTSVQIVSTDPDSMIETIEETCGKDFTGPFIVKFTMP